MNTSNIVINSDGNVTINGSISFATKTIIKHKHDFAVYIGRFQPFHVGHLHVVTEALKLADKLIIIVGSHNKPRDWKNPWTSAERIEMIRASLPKEMKDRVYFTTVEDRLYQDKEWGAKIYDAVNAILMDYSPFHLNSVDPNRNPKIAVVGYDKDDTSWYLNAFPKWKTELVPAFTVEENDEALSATMIRDMMYANHFGYVKHILPEGAFDGVREWMKTPNFTYVKEWYEFEKKYQKPYEMLPYGTNFYCADNVIMQGNYVLMIRRKAHPGMGLWALPGGHINGNENSFQAALRELREETGLKIPEKVIAGSYKGSYIFDHPERSLRGRCGKKVGRTISNSHCFVFTDASNGLPRVVPADDALEARWFLISEIRQMRDQIFEDHADQIEYWVARV